ncbi:hypothetical protein LTR53_002743 [Teratosphaeriaceae sp. CCFEE 6253]|nr:hypothetical protein LTR53_002743 [Teratosphaeriaceae sp. CCFEE 6253]
MATPASPHRTSASRGGSSFDPVVTQHEGQASPAAAVTSMGESQSIQPQGEAQESLSANEGQNQLNAELDAISAEPAQAFAQQAAEVAAMLEQQQQQQAHLDQQHAHQQQAALAHAAEQQILMPRSAGVAGGAQAARPPTRQISELAWPRSRLLDYAADRVTSSEAAEIWTTVLNSSSAAIEALAAEHESPPSHVQMLDYAADRITSVAVADAWIVQMNLGEVRGPATSTEQVWPRDRLLVFAASNIRSEEAARMLVDTMNRRYTRGRR